MTGFGSSTTYTYNGDGLRQSKTVSGTTTQELWDPSSGLPTLVKDGSTEYIYGPLGVLEQVTSTATLYYHQDQIGSTRLVTDSSGASAATYTFDPYGNLVSSTGSISNPFLYTGQYKDAESGFYYLRARYYDPSTGQFLTVDPAVSRTGEPYGYVTGAPLNLVDPSGKCGHVLWALAPALCFFEQYAPAIAKTPLRSPALAIANAGLTAISWVDDHGTGGTQVCIFWCAGLSVQGGKVSFSFGAAYGLSASVYVGIANLAVQCRQNSSLGAGGYSKKWGNNIKVGPGGGISSGTNPDGSTNTSDWEGDLGVGLGGDINPGGQTTISSWDTSELWVNQ